MMTATGDHTQDNAQGYDQGYDETYDQANDIIICLDVHKWYGSFHVIRGVTTTIKKGEVVVIMGPSGSGKSTFMRTINNLEQHQRGDIIVDGMLINDDTSNIDAIRRNIGMVSQNFDLFSHMKVLDNVSLAPIKVKKMKPKEAREAAMEVLERVGIPEKAGKFPHEMSGGEQQRAAIARALAMQPSIMLFDEPTWALDVQMTRDVVDVMKELAQSQITIVAITHQMGFAQEAADRVILFDQGQIVEDQPPHNFFNNPRHTRAQRFLKQVL